MFIFFTVLLVAISLSMDTFSLSLSYGMFNIKKKEILKISLTVGLFHFFMPILGNCCGNIIIDVLPIELKLLMGIIFLSISFNILLSLFKKEELKPINNIIDIIIFSFTVSIDSFSTGIGLNIFNMSHILISLIFMIVSFLFTFIGLSLGKVLHEKIGKIAEIIGIVILISLSIFYIIY